MSIAAELFARPSATRLHTQQGMLVWSSPSMLLLHRALIGDLLTRRGYTFTVRLLLPVPLTGK